MVSHFNQLMAKSSQLGKPLISSPDLASHEDYLMIVNSQAEKTFAWFLCLCVHLSKMKTGFTN